MSEKINMEASSENKKLIDLQELVKKEIFLNVGSSISECIEDKNNIISFSRFVDNIYCNNAYIEDYDDSLISKYQPYFDKKKLPLVFYVTNETEPRNVEELLQEKGFRLTGTDAVMVLKTSSKFTNEDIDIKEVEKKDEQAYLEIFDEVFCKEGDDVYSGTSRGYLDVLKFYFKNYPKERRFDYIAYKGDKPVGIAQVKFDEKYALLESIAVLQGFRNKGIIKSIIGDIGERFDDKIVFLSTEEGSVNDEIYKKLGFKTVTTGKFFVR